MIEIDPTIDYACKMLLGNPDHSRLTIHFLNAVLQADSPIVGVECWSCLSTPNPAIIIE